MLLLLLLLLLVTDVVSPLAYTSKPRPESLAASHSLVLPLFLPSRRYKSADKALMVGKVWEESDLRGVAHFSASDHSSNNLLMGS